MKRVLRFVLPMALLLGAPTSEAAPVDVDLKLGIWEITATDTSGLDWAGSTLVFETQVLDQDDWNVTGRFDWIGSNGASGGERFTGSLFSDRTLRVQGFELIDPVGIVTGLYFAVLDATGNGLINGNWTGAGAPSDDFSATRVVPLPAGALLFVSALFGGLGATRWLPRTTAG